MEVRPGYKIFSKLQHGEGGGQYGRQQRHRMPAEDRRNNNGAAGVAAEERRNELHLASHEQHRLTTASIIEHGIEAERNKFVYEVS